MSDIKRFTVNWSPEGTWVKHTELGACVYYDDHVKAITSLEQQIDALKAEVNKYREALEGIIETGDKIGVKYEAVHLLKIARQALEVSHE